MLNRLFFLTFLFLFSSNNWASQSQKIGQLEVHYSAFPSTFLAPIVAKEYQLPRSRQIGLINITVLDTKNPNKPAVTAQVQGYAKNLLGQRKSLNFKLITEGDNHYYLAQVRHRNEENITFYIEVFRGKQQGQLQFKQTFYTEP